MLLIGKIFTYGAVADIIKKMEDRKYVFNILLPKYTKSNAYSFSSDRKRALAFVTRIESC